MADLEKRVYLGGPISGLEYNKSVEWRANAQQQLKEWGIIGISPMRAKEFLAHEEAALRDYQQAIISSSGIVTRDFNDVLTSDAVLFNLLNAQNVSIGTMIEYGFAYALRKPIVTVIEEKGNIHDHQFIHGTSGFTVHSLDSGLLVVKAIFT